MVYWILTNPTWIPVVILELIHATKLGARFRGFVPRELGRSAHLLDPKLNRPDFGP